MRYYYLGLGRDASTESRRVGLYRDLAAATAEWSSATRISPLWRLHGRTDSPDPTTYFSGRGSLFFVHRVHPSDLTSGPVGDCDVWLSLGLFNAVIWVTEVAQCEAIRQWLIARSGQLFEEWEIANRAVVCVTFAPVAAPAATWRRPVVEIAGLPVPVQLRELQNEYVPLIGSALARSEVYWPELSEDLLAINAWVRQTLVDAIAGGEDAVLDALVVLTTTNAGLSRLTSQAFSGVSPIAETECHFWTHSLLGTGVANMGLWRLSAFVDAVLDAERIPQRVKRFVALAPPQHNEMVRLPSSAPEWAEELLEGSSPTGDDRAIPRLPLVTFFSGRDGFLSTPYTLSAPLATIGACSCRQWTLRTITHEISHSVVRSVLPYLMPGGSLSDLREGVELLRREPTSELEVLRKLLIQTALAMDTFDQGKTKLSEGPQSLFEALFRGQHEIHEILVHLFDFFYFYGDDHEGYIQGIWLSWSVIPNIEHKVQEYLLRTLCAVMVRHVHRGDDAEDATRDEVRAVLQSLLDIPDGGGAVHKTYIEKAVKYLDGEWESRLRDRLTFRRGLISIARRALFSSRIRKAFLGDVAAGAGYSRRGGYPHTATVYSQDSIQNPLLFVEQFTDRHDVSQAASWWLWYMLAMNVAEPDGAGDV